MENILSNLMISKVYSATTIFTGENTVTERRDRPCWAVLIKYEGETIYRSNGKKHISNAENMVILPKGSNYLWQCVKAGRYSIIEFESDLKIDGIFSFPIKNSEKMLSKFRSVEQKRLTKKSLYQMESIKETYSIILELLRSSEQIYTPSGKEQKLLPAIEYIRLHYAEKLINDLLADICGISTVYFRKLFTEVYGTSPINFVIDMRIKKAKEMLRSDYSSITDIAFSLGYLNIYDFSRDFKKHTGISPSNFNK